MKDTDTLVAENEGSNGVDVMDMVLDMPLVSALLFQQDALSMPAEEMVSGLHRQVHGL